MGYYTEYNLSIKHNLTMDDNKDIIKHLRKESEEAEYAINEEGWSRGNESRWYNHNPEMKEFSKKYPYVVFELEGIGEENGDWWKRYYKNGKTQLAEAEITFEEYDETKLV